MGKSIKLTPKEYQNYLDSLVQNDNYRWYDAIGKVLGIDPNLHYVISHGCDHIGNDTLFVTFLYAVPDELKDRLL